LDLQRFVKHFFAAGKVFASGKPRERTTACVEYIGWMDKFIHVSGVLNQMPIRLMW
jgi:hypothetical protein